MTKTTDGYYGVPEYFGEVYELLWQQAYRDGVSGSGMDGRHTDSKRADGVRAGKHVSGSGGLRVDSGAAEVVVESKGGRGGKDHGAGIDVGPTWAILLKGRIDRKLRQLARDMRREMAMREAGGGDTADTVRRRCSRCKRYGEGDWSYCPRDGKIMEDVLDD